MNCTDSLLMLKNEFLLRPINFYALAFKQHYHGTGWKEYARHRRIIAIHKENESVKVN